MSQHHWDTFLQWCDTDSFLLQFCPTLSNQEAPNFWNIFAKLHHWLDTSRYSVEHHPFFTENTAILKDLLESREKNRLKLGLLKVRLLFY